MTVRALAGLAVLGLAACTPSAGGTDGTKARDGGSATAAAAAPLSAALEPLWDASTYLEVTVAETAPRLRWRERNISVRVVGQRPTLMVQDEDYAADPTALKPQPTVSPPADGSPYWMVQIDCRRPGCLAVESRGSDGAKSERRGSNIWLARDEGAARRLAAALAAVIASPPAG